MTKATYYTNKKLRHKQQQFQADFPANKKYGMAPHAAVVLDHPAARAGGLADGAAEHSLLALARSGV